MVHQLSVSLEDMYNGATRKLALQKNVICDKCEGNCETETKDKFHLKLWWGVGSGLTACKHPSSIFILLRSWW